MEPITMPYILRLDASARHNESHSRRLADMVEKHLLTHNSDLAVRRRDLSQDSLPHIENETIAGFYTPDEGMTPKLKKATALSDDLIGELIEADTLLISTPMYNFSLPSSLKAWIDQISRIGKTFSYDGSGFEGLVPAKRAILVFSYGASGYTDGGAMAAMNFLEPYLVSLMKFLGIQDVKVLRIEGTTGDAAAIEVTYEALQTGIAKL